MADLFIRAGHECTLITNRRPNPRWTRHTFVVAPPYEEFSMSFEVCVEAGFQFKPDVALELKKKNPKCKFIRFYFEDQCLLDNLSLTIPSHAPSNPIRKFDEVWTYNHLERTIPYLEALHQCKVKTVPLVWDSKFLNEEITKLKTKNSTPFYASDKKSVICILEKNKNPYATCLTPLVICERLNQQHPDLIHKINITNCGIIKKSQRFRDLIAGLSVCNQDPQKVYFNNKWNNAHALSRWGKVVISNNATGDLDIRHLELIYLELPLLHNISTIKDFGYYYDAENISNATNQLHYSLTMHDENLDYYKGQVKECLNKFSGFNQKNVSAFDQVIK